MVLDFEEADDPRSLLRAPGAALSNGAADLTGHVVSRQPIGAAEKRALDGLSGVLASDNLTEVLSMLIKICYQRDVPMGSVFGWLREIAADGGRADVRTQVSELEKYLVNER
jgi:L-proline 3-hydroxylase, C-terminal